MKSLFSFLLLMIIGIGSTIFSQTVTIGTQEWMKENLNVSTFRNGDPIPEAKTNSEWKKAAVEGKPAWCYYSNDTVNGRIYGKLYNWFAVNDPRGLAPSGYHVPTDAEWTTLKTFLGESEGAKMKSKQIYETKVRYEDEGGYYETKWVACNNCSYWTEKQKANNACTLCRNERGKLIKTGKYIPKTKKKIEEKILIGGYNGTNESGFSGLPGGYRENCCRDIDTGFEDIGDDGYWWSSSENKVYGYGSTENGTMGPWYCYLYYLNDYLNVGSYGKDYAYSEKGKGYSVRCLRD